MAAAAPGQAPRAPKPAMAPLFPRHPQRDTPLLVQDVCQMRLCLISAAGTAGVLTQTPCCGDPVQCVTAIFTVCHCVSDPFMWGDNKDVPWSCWMPVVQKQSKKRKHLLPSSINLSTRGLLGSFTVS